MADDAERTEASLRHWKAETLRLRARLAEVEAENDGLRHVIEHGVKGNATRLTDLKAAQARLAEMTREAQLSRGATERAVARLAEVEAERDDWKRTAWHNFDELTARLAEVEAAVRAWVKDHAYAPDDIVLGDQGLTDSQLPALWALLDAANPGWRAAAAGDPLS